MDKTVTNKAQRLDEWLAIATYGLVPVARERIKLEIEAHYSELVAARIADGMAQQKAESAALLELGEPSRAAKEFRDQHLTEDEKKWLQEYVESSRKSLSSDRWFIFLMFGPLIVMQIWICTANHVKLSAWNWAGLSWASGALIIFTVINFKFRRLLDECIAGRDLMRRFLKLQLWTVFWQLVTFMMSFALGPYKDRDWILFPIPAIGCVIWIQRRLSLFRKLNKHGGSDSVVFDDK